MVGELGEHIQRDKVEYIHVLVFRACTAGLSLFFFLFFVLFLFFCFCFWGGGGLD